MGGGTKNVIVGIVEERERGKQRETKRDRDIKRETDLLSLAAGLRSSTMITML